MACCQNCAFKGSCGASSAACPMGGKLQNDQPIHLLDAEVKLQVQEKDVRVEKPFKVA